MAVLPLHVLHIQLWQTMHAAPHHLPHFIKSLFRHGQYGVAHRARCKADGQIVCLKRIPLQSKVPLVSPPAPACILQIAAAAHATCVSAAEGHLYTVSILSCWHCYCESENWRLASTSMII